MIDRAGRRHGVLWVDLGGPRPGIDREAWLKDFMSGIGGAIGGVVKGLWAWLGNAGLRGKGGS